MPTVPHGASDRSEVLRASRRYYAHRARYYDLFAQRRSRDPTTERELAFLEYAFRTHAKRPVTDVLDVACGGGRHIVGLAQRGYHCTGYDLTPERIAMARARAARAGVTVTLHARDATRLAYTSAFDAALALYILFLLPTDRDIERCLRVMHRALRPGGVAICQLDNPFTTAKSWIQVIHTGEHVEEDRAPGIRSTKIFRREHFDPIHGVAWIHETTVIEAPDGHHVFRDRERVRLLTYWDLTHYLQATGFRHIHCYPDWKPQPPKHPRAEHLVFVARK